jgi:hypothetical protein
MRTFAAVILATLGLSGSHVARADAPPDDPKSETVATVLAVSGTLVGPALIAIGLANDDSRDRLHGAEVPMLVTGVAFVVLGPSSGSFYAGKVLSRNLVFSLFGTGLVAVGAATVFGDAKNPHTSIASYVGASVASLGVIVIAGATALAIYDAPHEAADYNRRHRVHVGLAPLVTRTSAGTQTGLSVVGTF